MGLLCETLRDMRIELPENKKLVYEMSVPIRWGDMDAMGHVNNASYFRYLETIRIDWMQSIGCQPDPQGEGPVIINAFCNFYRQLEYPGNVLMKMYASDPGGSSFESWATMERPDNPGVIYAAGGATTVWVDFKAQKSRPLPDWLRAVIA
jgi:acyl-CoA thioester hydrolase